MKKLLGTCNDPGLVPIRLVMGILFIAHGWQKLSGLEGVAQFLTSLGFTAPFWAYLVAGGEFFGGVLLLIGLLTRLAALNIAVIMLVAIFKVHWANGLIGQGGFEYPLTLLAGAITLMISGGGKWSIDARLSGSCCGTGSTSSGSCCS